MRRSAHLFFAAILLCGFPFPTFSKSLSEFSKPDLLSLWDLAQRHDASLEAARRERDAGQEALPQGRAGLLPTVNLTAERARERRWSDEPSLEGGVSRERQDLDQTRVSAELTQPLLRFENWYAFRESALRADLSEIEFLQVSQSFRLRLVRVYLDSLKAQLQMDTLRSQLTAVEAQKRQAESRLSAGLVDRLDLLQATAEYRRVQAERVSLRSELEAHFRELETLTGAEFSQLAPLQDSFEPRTQVLAPMEHYVQRGLQGNPGIRAERLRKQIARQGAHRARSAYLPTLDLNFRASHDVSETHSGASSGFAEFPERETDSVRVSLQLNVPLFSGGRTTSAHREATSRAAQVEEELKASVEETRLSIEVSYRSLRHLRDSLTASEAALEAQEAALEATERSYEAGLEDMVQVVQAQRAWFAATHEHDQVRLDYLAELARLQAAIGELDRDFLATLNGWLEAA
ncbi:MAG: hypothetical protein EA349_16195 [Halomonadaceae bacterium]|nr:MAG: hypothetical protein EA349_16195 [Halomonadaceae bacterium]